MSNIRYVCLSDMHLGQDDSILTNLNSDLTGIDVSRPSPALVALCHSLRELIKADKALNPAPTLILAGDIFEMALTTMNNAMMDFERFIELVMPEGRELFDKILYIPGNHDHHMWELARETQYVEHYLKKTKPKDELQVPWHDSRMFEKDNKPLPVGYIINNLIQRYDHLKKFEVSIAYPNFGLYQGKYCAIFHHGHFVEAIYHLMSDLAVMLSPGLKPPADIGTIEAENFAWIDFFWSAMGRSGDVGPLVENIYISLGVEKARDRLISNLAGSLIKKSDRKWLKLLRKPIECLLKKIADNIIDRERSRTNGQPLSAQGEKGLKKYLSGPVLTQMQNEIKAKPDNVTFIFGHTHKPYEKQYLLKGYPQNRIDVYNTGGWVVEKTSPEPMHGAAAVLLDDNLNATSLRLYNETKYPAQYKVRVQEAGGEGATPNALTRHVRSLLEKTSSTWNEFSRITTEEIEKHKKYLKHRLDRLAKQS